MTHLRTTTLTGVLLAGSLVLATGAPAGAQVVETFPLDFSDAGTSDPGFCGVDGLVVDYTYDQAGTARIHQRGAEGFFYFHASTTYVETLTYDGLTVTSTGRTLEKDLHVSDNGNGTWDVLVLLTGPRKARGEDGRIISMDDGQTRIVLTVSAETGESVGEPEIVFGSTGTNDDFCADVTAYWGL